MARFACREDAGIKSKNEQRLMDLITLYARREPTADSVAIAYGLGMSNKPAPSGRSVEQLIRSGFFGKMDVVLYSNPEATEQVSRRSWYSTSTPRRSAKVVTHNCFRYSLIWLTDFIPGHTSVPKEPTGSMART